MANQSEQIDAMRVTIDKMAPGIRVAFLDAVKRVADNVNVSALSRALSDDDVITAMEVLNIESLEGFLHGLGLPAGQDSFSDRLSLAYESGAATAILSLPTKISTELVFDKLNPNAVQALQGYKVPLIRSLTATTREGVWSVVAGGLEKGIAPARQARVIRDIIGLTESQTKAVRNFRQQLIQQTNTPKDGFGVRRGMQQARNRRLTAIERRIAARQVRQGGMSAKEIDELTKNYHDRLLNRRALNVARTEANRASVMGQQESWRQAQMQGLLGRDARQKWIVTHDDRLRHTHREIPGMNPNGRKVGESFNTPEGQTTNPPLGTNCRCGLALVRAA